MAVGALTTAVVASQIATTIPYNVFAAEITSKTQATQATATQYYTTIPRLGDRKISVVHPDSKTISGYVHPGEMVTVHSNDGVIMGTPKFSVSTVADSVTGAFSVAIPQVPENAIVQIDLGTDHSLGAIVRSVTASDGVYHFGGTTVNPLTTDSTTVSGLIPPYSGAMITLADGTTLEAYSGADENYSATIPKQPEGAVIYVYKDYNPVDNDEFPAGGQSNNAQTTVTAAPAPDTTSPVITASNLSLQEGTSFNPKAGVTASDDTDGDITNKIVVTSNNVDTSKAGTYNVTYSVTDAAGNVATKTINSYSLQTTFYRHSKIH
ncbi:immunoglobulin-like domain-containing protein [Listeria riparia]|uniref:Cell wall surface anchor family protein n=1 Tax=Listeria riparia FSL S10-1204 TaxID=1265816 RepID=W7DB42_9LIST|nr:immunoglobulin-like domain-containing protein [Listeria riparia]EUJ44756.1 cell wall surface anchor family protein [Listeria riparia FSL S10-1204]